MRAQSHQVEIEKEAGAAMPRIGHYPERVCPISDFCLSHDRLRGNFYCKDYVFGPPSLHTHFSMDKDIRDRGNTQLCFLRYSSILNAIINIY